MSTPPQWLLDLMNDAAKQLYAVDILAPIGCHFYHADDQWEVTLFVARTEFIGGQNDGHTRESNFSLNLSGLFNLFDEVSEFRWQALPMGWSDDLGAHVSVEGIYAAHSVWLRIVAQAPDRFEPGRIINVYQGTWEEVW